MSCKQCNDAIRFDIFIHDLLTGILFIRPIFLYTLIWASQLLYYKQHNTTQQLLHTFSSRMLSNPFSWAWAPCECINPIYKPYIYSVQMNALNVCECVCVRTLYYIGFSLQERKKATRLCYDNVTTSTIRTLTNGKMAFSFQKPTFGLCVWVPKHTHKREISINKAHCTQNTISQLDKCEWSQLETMSVGSACVRRTYCSILCRV